MKKNKTTQLNKAYSKNFKLIEKDFFTKKDTGLFLFIEYLKYLRDRLAIEISADPNKQEFIKIKIATLVAAIAEFEAYRTSQDSNKKAFHWKGFCELIKLNMEEWLETNDSI
jgi:hypothetical protein